jgi:hypothetical protein
MLFIGELGVDPHSCHLSWGMFTEIQQELLEKYAS